MSTKAKTTPLNPQNLILEKYPLNYSLTYLSIYPQNLQHRLPLQRPRRPLRRSQCRNSPLRETECNHGGEADREKYETGE